MSHVSLSSTIVRPRTNCVKKFRGVSLRCAQPSKLTLTTWSLSPRTKYHRTYFYPVFVIQLSFNPGRRYSKAYRSVAGFDTFAPLGPVLVAASEIPDPSQLHLKTIVDGEVRQDETVGDLLFDCKYLISYLSQGTTLQKGSVIMTGTPGGE